jgi:gamma-glutamylputrescine oxidase
MFSLSIWEKETFYAPQDVVIIGAGLMGLWTALELKKRKPSLSITILERDTTPLGASTRNAGFACFGSPTELLYDAETMGEDAMWQIMEKRYKGIQKIRQHFNDATIQFDECGGYECFLDNAVLDEQLNWLNKGLQSITGNAACFEKVDEELPLLGLKGFGSLIGNKMEAGLHSGLLVKALTKKVQQSGVQVMYGANIGSCESYNNFVDVAFNNKSIKANTIVCCINAFTGQLFPELDIVPARGQVIVTSPIPNLSMKGTFHFDNGFYYWRNLDNRILLGGARNKSLAEEQTTALSTSTIIQNQLENFLQEHLATTHPYTIEHRWAGIMGFTPSKQPLLKQVKQNVFAAIACNGMGVALTPVFAEEVANQVLQNFS